MSNLGNSVGTSGVISGSGLQFAWAGGNNVTLSQSLNGSSGTITISAFDQTVQTQSLIAGVYDGANSISTGTVRFSNANGISFGINGQTLTGSHNAITSQTNQSAGIYAVGNTTGQSSSSTYDARTLSIDGAGMISAGWSNSTLRISATQSVQTQNLVDVTLAGNSTSAGAGYALMSSGTVTLAGGNNITLSQNGNAVTVSAFNQSNQSVGLYAVSNTTQSSSATADARSLSFAGAGIASVGATNNSIVVSVPSGGGAAFSAGMSNIGNTSGTSGTVSNQLVLAGGNNVTLSQSTAAGGNTITISAGAGGGASPVSTLVPYDMWPASTASQTLGALGATTGSAQFFPMSIDNTVHFNAVRIHNNYSFATSTISGQQTISSMFGLYSNNASTLSSISTGSFSLAITNSSVSATLSYPASTGTAGYSFATTTASTTAQIHSLMGTAAGARQIDLQFSNSMSLAPGYYWLGILRRESSSSANIGISGAVQGNVVTPVVNVGRIGVISSASTTNFTMRAPLQQGFGPYTSTGSAGYGGTTLPGSVFMSGIAHTGTILPLVTFIST
jgi:hypothetical protein